MSKQKLKQQIEEIFLELNLQDLPLTTSFEASIDEIAGSLHPEITKQATKKSTSEKTDTEPGVDADTLIEINETIDLIPYILNSFSQINGLSNLLIQGIDGVLSDQQLSDVSAIRRISESQSFLLKEIEELSRRSRGIAAEKITAFSINDLLTQIQTVFLKGEYRGVLSLDIHCPRKTPSLFTDSVFLRRAIIHSLELMVLFDKEIVINVENVTTNLNAQAIHIYIQHNKTISPNKEKPPSNAMQKTAKLHQFFIEHWIKQIDGQVVFEEDTNHRFSGIHIHVPVIADPNDPGAHDKGVERQTVLLISKAIPPSLKETASQLEWDLKQIKNQKEMDELENYPIPFCFINLAEYKTNWQEMNDSLFRIDTAETSIIPIFHEPKKHISAWFPKARMMINPIEPNELSSLVQHLARQNKVLNILFLDNKQYIARSLKSLEKQFNIQPIGRVMDDGDKISNSTLIIINLQLSPIDEISEETNLIDVCLTKKIPVIILLPEEIDQAQAGYFMNTLKSIVTEKDDLKTPEVVKFLT
jgi:hypothetical protein